MFTALILSAAISTAPAQWMYDNPNEAKAIVLASNMAIGCLEVGVGQAIAHNSFWKGCLTGLGTGALAFAGEYAIVYGGGLFGKTIFDTATSIQDNVMTNRGAFSRWQTDIGPVGLTFTRGSYIPKMMVNVASVVGIGKAWVDNNHFEVAKSLYYMTPMFSSDSLGRVMNNSRLLLGATTGNVIVYNRFVGESIISHEIVHTLQYRRFTAFNDIPWVENGYISIGKDIFDYGVGVATQNFAASYDYSPIEMEAFGMMKKCWVIR